MAAVIPERFVLKRAPRDDDELWWTVQALWGIKLPRTQVCPDHVPPFTAFADAYFARSPVSVWKACVPGDAAVLTVSGPVRADQVTPGTEVWSFDGTPVRAKVTDTWASGEQPILTIRTRSGDLRCTGNHIVLVGRSVGWRKYEQQWVRADEIVPGDMLIRAHGFGTDAADNDEDIDLAELAGLVLSDGSVQRNKFLIAHHIDAGYMAHYIEVIERMFGKPVRPDPNSRCTWLHSTDAAHTLLQLGLGGTAHTKRVPGWVFDLGRDGKLAFLRGYLDGDGTVRKDGVEYFSCSEWMMHDLRHLAMMIGLRVGRVTYQATSGECVVGGRVVQRGDMYSVRVYSNEIGSHDPKYTFRNKSELKPVYSGDGWVGQRVLDVDHGPAELTYDIEVEGTESFICDGYVVHNSRGYGGKSYLLAVLSATEMCMLGADVNLLGGSGAQSINIHSHTQEMWAWVNSPRALLSKEPTRLDTWTKNGGHIRSLTASQTSVRGPHPQRLRLDEIDEMDMDILEAAQGQPMRKKKPTGIIETQTVMCVVGGTKVLTNRGEVPITTVSTDDHVMTRMGWRQVERLTLSGHKETVQLKLSNGRTLTCTDNHRIAVPGGWMIPRNMSVGQEVCVHRASVDRPIHPPVSTGQGPLPDPARGVEWPRGDDRPGEEPVFVVDILAGGSHDVYDLSVRGVHEFVAEGIVIHNSSTHQYPDRTMSQILARAKNVGWPIFQWCIGQHNNVLTKRGWIAIKDVSTEDKVYTRSGWRDVQHVTNMGVKETLKVTLTNGTSFTCTPDHLVAVPGGFLQAGSLRGLTATDAAVSAPIRPLVGVDLVVGMPTGAVGLQVPSVLVPVGSAGDEQKVVGVDTVTDPAVVVDLHPVGDRTLPDQPGNPVSHLLTPGRPDVAYPVPSSIGGSLPTPVPVVCLDHPVLDVLLRQGDGTDPSVGTVGTGLASLGRLGLDDRSAFACVHVASITCATTEAVYDIGVEGDAHEFIVNGVVVHNCYRETSNPEDGWLTQDEVNRKKQEINTHMWDTEYELQEPNFDNRAIDPDLVAKAFSPLLGETQGDSITVLHPDQVTAGMRFVTGVDWAKKRDSTIIATYLIEPGSPNDTFRCIAWQRLGKRPWPEMVREALKQWMSYGGRLIHDATGVGDVVDDLILEYVTDSYLRKLITPYIMTGGAKRSALFSEYVAAIERTEIVHPRVWYAYDEHRYMTDDDLFGQGHPPDSVVAASLAWSLRDRRQTASVLAIPRGFTQTNDWRI